MKHKKLIAFILAFLPLAASAQEERSRWDRYLGLTAPMTQVPVPTATNNRASSPDLVENTPQNKGIMSLN